MAGIKDRFGRLTTVYKWMEYALMGSALHEMRTCFLATQEFSQARQVLILGEGDGRFLEAALIANPKAHFCVVDGSSAMLRRTKGRIPPRDVWRVSFVCMDARELSFPEDSFDGLVMHCFLDCFLEPAVKAYLPQWLKLVRCDGFVWIGDFVEPEQLGWAWLRLRGLFCFFRLVTRVEAKKVYDPRSLMKRFSWEVRRESCFGKGALASRIYSLTSQD